MFTAQSRTTTSLDCTNTVNTNTNMKENTNRNKFCKLKYLYLVFVRTVKRHLSIAVEMASGASPIISRRGN